VCVRDSRANTVIEVRALATMQIWALKKRYLQQHTHAHTAHTDKSRNVLFIYSNTVLLDHNTLAFYKLGDRATVYCRESTEGFGVCVMCVCVVYVCVCVVFVCMCACVYVR